MDISATRCQGNVREFQSVWRVVSLVTLTDVLLPTLGMIEENVQPSPLHYLSVDRLEM